MLIKGLAGVRGIRCAVPEAGMFTLIDVRDTGLSGYDFMSGLFRSERVSVLDGGAFGEATRGFVRLCFAKSLGATIQPARNPGIECDFDKLLMVTTCSGRRVARLGTRPPGASPA